MLKNFGKYMMAVLTFCTFTFGVLMMFMANGWADAIPGIIAIGIGFILVKKG